jgi:TonB family protein
VDVKPLIAFLLAVWLAGWGAAREQEKPQSQDQQSKPEAPAQPPPPAPPTPGEAINQAFQEATGLRPIILSDTQGFDFGPYLARIVSVVRRNWYALIPQAARSGEKGRVAIVFEILKDGSVPQLRLVASSGSDLLDRAALGGVRASAPFPLLPAEFAGKHLVVEFTFLYNLREQPAATSAPVQGGVPGGVPGGTAGGVISGIGSGKGGGLGPGSGGGTGGGPYAVGGNVSPGNHSKSTGGNYTKPTAISRPFPDYTRKARKAKLEGIVALKFTVDAQGNVSDIQVTKSLGMGLDEKAVEAVRKWKFHPARRDGVPVPASMSIAFRFGPSYRTPQEDAQTFAAAGFESAEPPTEPNQAGTAIANNPGEAPRHLVQGEGEDFGKGAYKVGGNVSAPVPTYEPQPSYSDQARRAKLKGTVVLEIVVDAQGNVSDVRVQKSLGKGLEEKAVEAVSKWKFHPATREGVPVPVIIDVEVAFRLI